jgi:sugar phosphate isomerase/epimerase
LGASQLVAVVGGLASSSRDIRGCRQHIQDGLAALFPTIQATGVKIALEPLHPFYASNRSLLNTLDQATDWCEALDPQGTHLGIAVDAYHVWWDPYLQRAIQRAGPRISALHVCDWLRDTQEPLLDRGMMGDGVIDLQQLRADVEGTGYQGLVEVEIFSRDHWWQQAPETVLQTCRERMLTRC